MISEVTEDRRTGRVTELTMEAESFAEQQILRMLVDGMMPEEITFKVDLPNGEGTISRMIFSFGNTRRMT